jgi:hypothetical protein
VGKLSLEVFTPEPDERFYSGHDSQRQEKRYELSILYRPLTALDSEGADGADNYHYLTNVQALWGNHQAILEQPDIRTHQVLNYLMHLPSNHTNVIYAGNYDFNMWLRDIDPESMRQLLKEGQCTWRDYFLMWIPNKKLVVKRGGVSQTIYDVFSFYQKSFVKACADSNIGTPEELELIVYMKELRGNFANVDPDKIRAYCWLELELLQKLVQQLRSAILQTKYRPTALYGPGALANAILRKEKVKDHYGAFDKDLALRAYYGGRFDSAELGWYERVYQHDIRSAYPHQIRYLPCTRNAYWERTRDPSTSRYGMYHVKWKLPEDTIYPPFPWRDKDHRIYYLTEGQGWYHAEEVRAAIEVFGSAIKVVEGQALIEQPCDLGCNGQPYRFVEDLYQWRLALKAEGKTALVQVVKLDINSIYGKTVQSVGSKKKDPPFQNFFLGGAITAGTRAQIMRAIAFEQENILAIATDGLISRTRLNLPEGIQLGEWEILELFEHVQLGNGIYKSSQMDPKTGELLSYEKSRGFPIKLLDYGKVKEYVEENGPWGKYWYNDKRRFITLRAAYNRNDPELACHWTPASYEPPAQRPISLTPERRDQLDINVDGVLGPHWYDKKLQWRRYARKWQSLGVTSMSAPYKPKQSWEAIMDIRAQYYPEIAEDDY